MARSEKQIANLEKGKATRFKAGEEQAKIASKGGKARQAKARQLKTMREELEILLAEEITRGSGANRSTMTVQEATMRALIKNCLKGNVKSLEFLRDTVGQKPVEQIVVSEIDQEVMKQVEDMVNEQVTSY